MRFNNQLIEKLRNGEIAVKNDGPPDQLRAILKEAFPNSPKPSGDGYYYFRSNDFKDEWTAGYYTSLWFHSLKDFFMSDSTKEDLIAQLKNLAKNEGLSVDVIFEKKKDDAKVTVDTWCSKQLQGNLQIFSFDFAVNTDQIINYEQAKFLAKKLQEYLNQTT